MHRSSTLYLRGVIVLIGLFVLTVCVIWLPRAIVKEMNSDFDYLPIMLGLYLTAVPFFIALYHGLTLLGFIDKNQAFTPGSVSALKYIKYCGFCISGLYTLGLPYIFYLAQQDDAPGLVLFGFMVVGASFIIATAAALFQRLFQDAINVKTEHDLTV